jgi:hypothetical protein
MEWKMLESAPNSDRENNQPHAIPGSWSHDIQYIDGTFVEDVVTKFQAATDEEEGRVLLSKIFRNFDIFMNEWANIFAPWVDAGLPDGRNRFFEVLWKSAEKYAHEKTKKRKGKAFNAYFVSALINTEKNLRSLRGRNPLIRCPVCEEDVQMINDSHLLHLYDVDRYCKTFVGYPLSSWDGMVTCPFTKARVGELTEAYVNRVAGGYSAADWLMDFDRSRGPFPCPVTGLLVNPDSSWYPGILAKGYTEEEFVSDFPDFPGIIECPFCSKRMLRMTDEHLASHAKDRISLDTLKRDLPNITIRARPVKVTNPYTGESVDEITLDMIRAAGTTVRDHLERYHTIKIGHRRKKPFFCPFTGKPTYTMKKERLVRLGRTPYEFYQATCQFPLRRFQIRCALCGEWTDNIGAHLDEAKHAYALPVTFEEYKKSYGGKTRNSVQAMSFVEHEDGERTSAVDAFTEGARCDIDCLQDLLDMSMVFTRFARDALDRRIIESMNGATSLVDVCDRCVEKRAVTLDAPYEGEGVTALAREIKKLGIKDFDVFAPPAEGGVDAFIVEPSRTTIFKRLRRMASRASKANRAV